MQNDSDPKIVIMLTIERVASQDPRFLKLVAELDADLAAKDGDDHAFYNQFNSSASLAHCLICQIDGRAVGCGALKPFNEQAVEIKRMYTLEDFRGSGIATAILKQLEDWAKELGYKKCVLETGKRQPEAIGLYLKNNYQIIANYPPYQGVSNSVCFEKVID